MKTIKAIFTTQFQLTPMGRRFAFNTTLDVEVGDLIEGPDYKGKLLQVVAVEDEVYKSFSYKNGELFKEVITDSGYGLIKALSNESAIVEEVELPETEEEGF